jgi:hypothetical protein
VSINIDGRWTKDLAELKSRQAARVVQLEELTLGQLVEKHIQHFLPPTVKDIFMDKFRQHQAKDLQLQEQVRDIFEELIILCEENSINTDLLVTVKKIINEF